MYSLYIVNQHNEDLYESGSYSIALQSDSLDHLHEYIRLTEKYIIDEVRYVIEKDS